MAKIVKRQIKLVTDGVDIARMLVVAKPVSAGLVDYPDFVQGDNNAVKEGVKQIPFVAGQLTYLLSLPEDLPISEGEFHIGAAPQDAAGNVGAITQKQYFFDFTAPAALQLEIL